jgi:hypothetical protein
LLRIESELDDDEDDDDDLDADEGAVGVRDEGSDDEPNDTDGYRRLELTVENGVDEPGADSRDTKRFGADVKDDDEEPDEVEKRRGFREVGVDIEADDDESNAVDEKTKQNRETCAEIEIDDDENNSFEKLMKTP